MFTVSGNNISLTRGDSASLHVDLTQGDAPYEPQAGDVLTLTVKDDPNDAEAILTLTADSDCTFHFAPSDTDGLAFGSYKYDIQLETGEDVYTPIVATFSLTEEVTWSASEQG